MLDRKTPLPQVGAMKSAESTALPLPKVGPSDRLGAVAPASAPGSLEGADLTNVIVLSHRRNASGIEAPAVTIDDKERPAPFMASRDRVPWTAFAAAVLLLHLALVLVFLRDPAPIQSLALDSISVEIVLGGQSEAGTAQTPSPAESAPSPPAESAPEAIQPPTETTEQARPDLRPRIETEANEPPRQEQKREEPKPQEPQTAAAEPEPATEAAEPEPAPATAKPEPAAVTAAAEVEPEPKAQEPDEPKPVEEPAASQPPKQEPAKEPREQSRPTPPRLAAARSGVGVGSSREIRNWASQVSAHLARNKRYPADALSRGIGGTASVAFALGADGRVVSVRLVRSSGNASLDRESQDLVRRASPFPPPPHGKASITVPVNFNVRTGR
ncbi:energy transducer TonB [Pseudorhodoplanes sp.]|uniref:energy transducer TonB n=1 Tax=Pseudorhodoplanes sp. TaxID=1934341 RepID=UPI003D0CF281